MVKHGEPKPCWVSHALRERPFGSLRVQMRAALHVRCCLHRRAARRRSPRGTVCPARRGVCFCHVTFAVDGPPARRRFVARPPVASRARRAAPVQQAANAKHATQWWQRRNRAFPLRRRRGSSGRRGRAACERLGARWLCVRLCKSCGRGEPQSPGADVAGVSPVAVQIWQG